MVIQRGWRGAGTETAAGSGGTGGGVAASQLTSSSEDSNGSWAAPGRAPAGRTITSQHAASVRQPITRQVAINTLAAMHRRFSLPGPAQPHSRPVAEFRASANKSLDTLRQTLQSAVTREIDQVIKKYLEKFFVPAVNNIRLNLGEESVSEDQMRAVCRAMLDATRSLYAAPPRASPTPADMSDSDSSEPADARHNKHSSPMYKRKESDTDSEGSGSRRKRVKQEAAAEAAEAEGAASPLPPAALRDPHKWDPARLTQDTLFIMGSHAHKVLGLGSSRGRLYTKHSGLLRYPADSADKEWIATHNLMNAVGGKTYIMVLEDIEELAATDHYRTNALPMLGELTGFKAPPFMLRKMKAFLARRLASASPQPSTSGLPNNVKQEGPHEGKLAPGVGSTDVITDFPDLLPVKEEDQDFDLIKVDGIKVEDIDDLKVDGIKVEDLDEDDIKVENIDDISVDGIKVEDIKLESEDAFSMCKQSEDDPNLVEGLLEADIEFLSRNLGNIESEADARKTIEKLTGANPDTLTLMGDEFDFGTTLNTNYPDTQSTKCITVVSTTSGMVHSVPVSHLTSPVRYTAQAAPAGAAAAAAAASAAAAAAAAAAPRAAVHHLPQATVTIHSVSGAASQLIRGLPLNSKTGTFSTVVSTGAAGAAGLLGLGARQYLNVTPSSFPTGHILHNAIVSRNMLSRNFHAAASAPAPTTCAPTAAAPSAPTADADAIATARDMIDNACNSSLMLKKVLTLGSAGAAKSFVMRGSQRILATGFATGSGPRAAGGGGGGGVGAGAVGGAVGGGGGGGGGCSALSATHATLSALLAASADSSHHQHHNHAN